MLQHRYAGKLDARADEFIQHAVEGAQRMQNLIHDLLAFSRLGTQGKPFERVAVGDIVQSTLSDLKTAIEENAAKITHDEFPTVVGDAAQLQQVFQNLVSNAIKFRGEDAPRIHIGCRLDNSDELPKWVFSVQDHGLGIEPQYFERIFIMFKRLHTRAQHPGTGIGLAICKKVVERHGGQIWVSSEFGKGSTFFFSLPVQNVEAAQMSEENSSSQSLS